MGDEHGHEMTEALRLLEEIRQLLAHACITLGTDAGTPLVAQLAAVRQAFCDQLAHTQRLEIQNRTLREREAHLKTVIENLDEGVVVSNPDGTLRHWNRAALALFGYSSQMETPHQLSDFTEIYQFTTLDGAIVPYNDWPLARTLRGETVHDLELYIRRLGTDWQRIYRYCSIPVRDAHGQLVFAVVTINDVTDRKQAEEALRESEERLSLFITNAPAAIAMFDRDMRYLAVSRRWMSDYGLDDRDVIGQSHYAIFPEIGDAWKAVHQRALAGAVVTAAEDRFVRLDGSVQWLRWEVMPWYRHQDGTVGGIIMFTEDITALKTATEQLERQNRTLRLLSDINQALIRTGAEDVLLQRVCDIAVTAGGYRLAWVGYLEQDAAKTVRPVAHAGDEDQYLEQNRFTWEDSVPEGQGPLGRAVRTRHPVSADDILTTPHFEPWRAEALTRGFRSVIVLPLIAYDEVFGVFVLYRWQPHQFTTEECNLFMELADDLAFGIATLRLRQARRQAEEALHKSEAQYRSIVETAREGIWVLDSDLRATYANQHMGEMLGYPLSEILGRPLFDFIDPELHDELAQHLEKRKQGLQEVYEFRFRRADGSNLWALVSGSPLRDDQGQFAGSLGMLTDVTELHKAEATQREFARKTIEAATEGKLIICDRQDILRLAGPPLASWDIMRVDDLEAIRHAIAEFARAAGMDDDRVSDFLLCISEATTNAFKHAGHGVCSLHRVDDALMAVVADQGPGIPAINLPELALKRGYTTAVSLGMGYKAMISIADTVYLATGSGGTTVGINMTIHPAAAPPPLSNLLEMWKDE